LPVDLLDRFAIDSGERRKIVAAKAEASVVALVCRLAVQRRVQQTLPVGNTQPPTLIGIASVRNSLPDDVRLVVEPLVKKLSGVGDL
jgi:hypothetical protein